MKKTYLYFNQQAVCAIIPLVCLVVSLILLLPSQAYSIVNCYDYVLYRLHKKDLNPPPPGSDNIIYGFNDFQCVSAMARRVMIKDPQKSSIYAGADQIRTVLNDHNYNKETWVYGAQPPLLSKYDVIIVPGHAAFVNESGTIDHFIQVPGSSGIKDVSDEFFPRDLTGTYWTVAQIESELFGPLCKISQGQGAVRSCLCGGLYRGDTFDGFLSRISVKPGSGEIWRNPGLTVLVLDKKDNKPVDEALVELAGTGSTKTNSEGRAVFNTDPFRKSDYSVTVTAAGFAKKSEPLSSSHIVYLEARDPVKEAMDKLTGSLNSRHKEVKTACDSFRAAFDEFNLLRSQLLLYQEKLKNLKKSVEETSTDCATLPFLKAEIQGLVRDVKSSEAALQGKLDAANLFVCKTQGDLARLEALWNEITKLAWDVYLNAGKAEGRNNRLRKIKDKFNDLKTRLAQKDQDLQFPLSDMPEKAAKLLPGVTNSSAKMQDAYKEAAQKREACLKAHDEALITFGNAIPIDFSPAGAMKPIDSRVAPFQRTINDWRSRCNCSSELTANIDPERLKIQIEDIKKAAPEMKKELQQIVTAMATLFVCEGQKAEDDLISQANASQTILIYAYKSNIPDKINNCRTLVAQTPPKPAKKISSFSIQPKNIEMSVGQSQEFKAYVTYTDGTSEEIKEPAVTWSQQPRMFTARKDQVGKQIFIKATTQLDKIRTDTAEIKVKVDQSSILLEVQCSPNPALPSGQVSCSTKLDRNTEASLGSMAAGGWGYYWYIEDRDQKNTGKSISFTVPKNPQKNKYRIVAWLVRKTVSRDKVEYLKTAETVLNIRTAQDQGSYNKGTMIKSETIPARNSKPTPVGVLLEKGKPYIVVGKGSVSLWDGQTDGCDSVFRYKTPLEPNGGPRKIWGQLRLVKPNGHLSDFIKQQTGKDPEYNPGHVYEAVIMGQGLPLEAIVHDGGTYSDNHGELTVEVYEALPMQ